MYFIAGLTGAYWIAPVFIQYCDRSDCGGLIQTGTQRGIPIWMSRLKRGRFRKGYHIQHRHIAVLPGLKTPESLLWQKLRLRPV